MFSEGIDIESRSDLFKVILWVKGRVWIWVKIYSFSDFIFYLIRLGRGGFLELYGVLILLKCCSLKFRFKKIDYIKLLECK